MKLQQRSASGRNRNWADGYEIVCRDGRYPSTVSSMNVSKETALFTTIKINGYPEEMIESFFSNIIQPEINADYICTTFFGMPDYEEMLSLFEQSVKK